MSITFLQLAQRVLSEENHALTPSEIWQIAVNKGYDKLVDSNGKTPWATLGALIYVDVRDNLSTIFVPIGVRPKRFILKDQQSTLSEKEVETPRIPHTQKSDFLEKDLITGHNFSPKG